MVLLLDPRLPIVWRSPTSLQVGVDRVVAVLAEATLTDERLMAALAAGTSRSGLDMLARASGGDTGDVDRLLAALGCAVLDSQAQPPTGEQAEAGVRVAVVGRGPTAVLLARHLAEAGVEVSAVGHVLELGDDDARVGVALGHWVFDPEVYGTWLRRDIPHLPVLFTESGVRIGPLVDPGVTACLHCLDRYRLDADPAWPAIASQLWGRRSLAETGLLAAETSVAATRAVLAHLAGRPANGVAIRLGADGERTAEQWSPHPDCGCVALGGVTALEGAPLRESAATRGGAA